MLTLPHSRGQPHVLRHVRGRFSLGGRPQLLLLHHLPRLRQCVLHSFGGAYLSRHFLMLLSASPAALSLLDRTGLFLYPIFAVLILYLFAIVFGFNWSLVVFRWYGFHDS